MIQRVVGSQPAKSIPAALRTALRPPSQPTRYCARSDVPLDSATSAVVLRETRHLALAQDGNAQLIEPAGQDALEAALQQRHPVGMAGGEIADLQQHPGEYLHLRCLSLGEKAIDDTALIQHLDGAGVQAAGARAF
jgi:hypothetical protein